MHVKLLLLHEMQSVELAGGEEVGHFLAILAAVDVEDQLLPCKDVVFVEGAARLLLLCASLEHKIINRKGETMSSYIQRGAKRNRGIRIE